MMKTTALCLSLSLSLLLSGGASATELADANKLYASHAYPAALQLYTKLASGGNVEAQMSLGKMYWSGDAGAVDLVKAEMWLKKAAAKGDKSAVALLDSMRQNVARRAEIEFWISKYDGAELRAGKYRCPLPRFPAVSRDNEEIKSVSVSMTAWQECHNGFVAHLKEVSPLVKLIPVDIAKLLSEHDKAQATAHMDEVYERIAVDAQITGKLALADFTAWRDATEAYVAEHNRGVNAAPSAEQIKYEKLRQNNFVPPPTK